MHGGSSKITKNWQLYKLKRVRVLHTSGGCLVTLIVPIENDLNKANWKILREEHLVHQGEQMYEHIAYELRYGNLSSIEHGSICMKAHYFI